jgi:uncharacterized protein with ACT and thioredoxin-like domain
MRMPTTIALTLLHTTCDPHVPFTAAAAATPCALRRFRNIDRPGAVSDVLQVLSDSSINVARMNVGRQEGELALCLMDLDTNPDAAIIEKLKALDSLSDVFVAHIQ